MERNSAAARHSWARRHAWLLLNLFLFPVGQTIYAHCRIYSHQSRDTVIEYYCGTATLATVAIRSVLGEGNREKLTRDGTHERTNPKERGREIKVCEGRRRRCKASVLMQTLSYPTESVLSYEYNSPIIQRQSQKTIRAATCSLSGNEKAATQQRDGKRMWRRERSRRILCRKL